MKRIFHKYSFQDENNVGVTDNIEIAVSNMSNDDASLEGISTGAVVLGSNNTDEQDGEYDGEEEENDDDDDDDDEEEDDDDDEEDDDDDEQNGAFFISLKNQSSKFIYNDIFSYFE